MGATTPIGSDQYDPGSRSTPLNVIAIAGYMVKANNLSDVASVATARDNLNVYAKDDEYDYVDFNKTASADQKEGRIQWNDDDKTLEIDTEITGVKIQVGQEQVVRCVNKSGALISNGQVVYITGAQGQRPTISLAKADSVITSGGTLGLATHDIADNATGYVTTNGLVRDIDTSSFTEGFPLWLSPTTAGGLVQTRPSAPNQGVITATCLYSHATQGILCSRVVVVPRLASLPDVNARGSQSDREVLIWDDGNGYWIASSVAFSEITSTPTTLAGYGITDAASSSHTHTFASLTSTPTTLAGYGITDAASSSHTHTFASLTSKPTTIAGYGITDAFEDIVEDTTPQLGGDLDLNGKQIIIEAPSGDHLGEGIIISGQVDVNSYGIGAALGIASDGNWEACDADTATDFPCSGIALESGTGIKKILLYGAVRDNTWAFVVGAPVYVSNVEGNLTTTAPIGTGDSVQRVGVSLSADTLLFTPSLDVIVLA